MHVPVRTEFDVAHLADEHRRFPRLHRAADDHGHGDLGGHIVAPVGEGPEPERRNVDGNQRSGRALGQPAQALQRQLDLPYARRDGRAELIERVLAEHAVVLEPMPGLECAHAVDQRALILVVGRRTRGRGKVAHEAQTLAQCSHAGIALARLDFPLACGQGWQRRHRDGGEASVARQRLLESPVQWERWLRRGDGIVPAPARHAAAQQRGEIERFFVAAELEACLLRRDAPAVEVRQEAEERHRQRDVRARNALRRPVAGLRSHVVRRRSSQRRNRPDRDRESLRRTISASIAPGALPEGSQRGA